MSDAGNNTSALLAELLTLPGERRLARVRESLGEFANESTKVTDALVSLGDEAERLAVVEVSRALSASELSVSLADEANAPRARARARRARGQALAYAGRFDEALGLCAEAERIATAHGEAIEAARAKLASMHALSELGRYDEAITAGETARQAFLAAGRPELAARADINLGKTHQNRDDPRTALIHLDRARTVLRQEPVLVGHIDLNRGEALLLLNDFAETEGAMLSAKQRYEEAGVKLMAGVAEGNLAELAARQGQLQRALFHFERARQMLDAQSARSHQARVLAESAETVATLGLAAEAVDSLREIIPRLQECGLAVEEARARASLGRTLLSLGRHAEAQAELEGASQAYGRLGQERARARVELVAAELALVRGRVQEARSIADSALTVLADRPVDSIAIRSLLARIALKLGDWNSVESNLATAIARAQELDIAPLLADLMLTRGLLHRERRELDAAISAFRDAVAQTERIRGSLQAERFRAAFLGNRLAPYEELVRALVDRGGSQALGEAFATVEKIKSRALLDLVRGAIDAAEEQLPENQDEGAAREPERATLLNELARLRRELNALYSRLSSEGRMGERKLAFAQWHEALHERETALERLQTRLSSARGLRRLGVSELFTEPILLAEAQQLPGDGGVLIEYFVAQDELMAFVMTPHEHVVVRELGTRSELNERVARVQFQLRRALRRGVVHDDGDARLLSDMRRELLSLWRMIFAPLARHVADAARLLIVPHGPLHLIPFHALWDGQRFLIEQYEFVYGPSASVLAHAAATNDGQDESLRSVVIGVADQLAPRIDAEVRTVAGILNTDQVLLNGAATCDAFLTAAGDARVLHLACHGRFSATKPMASGLQLSDRWLTAREIYGLRLNADLVTLSGCETGRHLVASGDEILGLVRGFLAAGATSLLVSLWSANDETTSEMMGRFYQLWHSKDPGGLSKASALRQAQLEALARRPHPASWAPFVLVGRP